MFGEEIVLTGQVNDPSKERPPSFCILVSWSSSKPECCASAVISILALLVQIALFIQKIYHLNYPTCLNFQLWKYCVCFPAFSQVLLIGNLALIANGKWHHMPQPSIVCWFSWLLIFSDLFQSPNSTWAIKFDKVVVNMTLRKQRLWEKKE